MRPLGLLQQVFDLGGRGAGRWLKWVATSVIHGVSRMLLQSWVIERVVVKEIAACVMGVWSGWERASMIGGGG